MVTPDTFNDDFNVVLLFNVVTPDTFNDDIHDVALFNVVVPDTFNDDIHVVLFDSVVNPDTFNDDNNVVLFDIIVLLNILKVVKLISAFCVLVIPILNDILPYSCYVKVSVVWSNWI